MVTDVLSNYASPAGREFTMAAARVAGISTASRVLDMGCGYGEGACNLAAEFRCRVRAVDASRENLDFARELATGRGVGHLITFEHGDITKVDLGEEPVDLVLAEGGVLSFVSRRKGLEVARRCLAPRGWLAFSDLIFLSEQAPDEIRTVFEDERYHYESEGTYRSMADKAGFEVHLMCLVPSSGWDNYYAHMAKRLEDDKGFFADRRVKLAFHREIDVFYRLEALRYIGYLFCVARKKE